MFARSLYQKSCCKRWRMNGHLQTIWYSPWCPWNLSIMCRTCMPSKIIHQFPSHFFVDFQAVKVNSTNCSTVQSFCCPFLCLHVVLHKIRYSEAERSEEIGLIMVDSCHFCPVPFKMQELPTHDLPCGATQKTVTIPNPTVALVIRENGQEGSRRCVLLLW
jgi:hypothetical protein